MKILLLLIFLPVLSLGQSLFSGIDNVAVDPAGVCAYGAGPGYFGRLQFNVSTGKLWGCVGGFWTLLAAPGGGGVPKGFGANFTNGGNALSSGAVTYFTLPYGCTIAAWNITISPADTATFDIWKIATGTAIPTVTNSIVASAAPAIASGTALHSTTLTSWTTTVTANDIFGIKLQAVGGTATQVTLNVECN